MALSSVLTILSVPIYFHALGNKMYALWFYVQTFTGAFGFMDLGLGVAVGRYIGVALGRDDILAVKQYWATGHAIALPFLACTTILAIFVGVFAGPGWFRVTDAETTTLKIAMFAGGLGLFFNFYGQMWLVLSQAHLDFRFLSFLRSAASLLSVIGCIFVAILTRNAAALVIFTTFISAIQFFALRHRASRTYSLPVNFSDFRVTRLQEMLPFTLKIFGQLLSASVLGTLDRLVLGRMASASAFSSYNVSLGFANRILSVSAAAMAPIFSNTSRGVGGDPDRQPAHVYRESFKLMLRWSAIPSAWLITWHTIFLDSWLGSGTASEVAKAFPWVISGSCLAALSNVASAQLASLNRAGTTLLFSSITNVLSAIFVVIGWEIHGLMGAGIGFCLSRSTAFVQDYILRVILRMGYDREDFRQIMAVFFMVIFFIVFSQIEALSSLGIAGTCMMMGFTGVTAALYLIFPDLKFLKWRPFAKG